MPPSDFTRMISSMNFLDIASWHFKRGMGFRETEKWWAGEGNRREIHNGLDILHYRDLSGNLKSLSPSMKVPALYQGRVEAVTRDFLGFSIFFSHDIFVSDKKLFSALGHVKPLDGITPGVMVKANEAVAVISTAWGKAVPPHLHISLFFPPEGLNAKDISWERLADAEFIDPISVF